MESSVKCRACELQVRLTDIKIMANDIKLNLDVLIDLYYKYFFNVDSIVRDDYNVIVKNFDHEYGLNQLMLAGNSVRNLQKHVEKFNK